MHSNTFHTSAQMSHGFHFTLKKYILSEKYKVNSWIVILSNIQFGNTTIYLRGM